MSTFLVKTFNELSLHELYQLLKLRAEVFIVEQNCAYLDLDDKDLKCLHVLCYNNGQLIAYTRIVPPGISYTEPSIGRVVNHKSIRGTGTGKLLMNFSIAECQKRFPNQHIVISAQCYLLKFYNDLKFIEEGESYLEDDIPHIKMRYSS
jgi:ElaA protein